MKFFGVFKKKNKNKLEKKIDLSEDQAKNKIKKDDNKNKVEDFNKNSDEHKLVNNNRKELKSTKNKENEKNNKEEVDSEEKIYEHGLAKSRSTFGKKLNALLANFRSIDEGFFDNLEEMLIQSDVGFDTALEIVDELREEAKLKNVKKKSDVKKVVIKKLIDSYHTNKLNTISDFSNEPIVILVVGVNGVGKTTTIGKLAYKYKNEGKKVLLAAADTFRAGAIEQLDKWAKKDQVAIVKKPGKSDPASVAYEAVKKAKEDNYDVVLIDTAGRLQNKVNLMNELSKIKRVIGKEISVAPQEVLLVLDATTGQNAMTQAKIFKEVTDVSGLVLTKIDGTAKGGIILAINRSLKLPVKYVGFGEKVIDLRPFNSKEFMEKLFSDAIKV